MSSDPRFYKMMSLEILYCSLLVVTCDLHCYNAFGDGTV